MVELPLLNAFIEALLTNKGFTSRFLFKSKDKPSFHLEKCKPFHLSKTDKQMTELLFFENIENIVEKP
ncbi:hypothetical protein CW306_11475 [Bacillus sp. BA3]|nr:hypothetical protein CW306_11475 [Bacillus sp. BA3]